MCTDPVGIVGRATVGATLLLFHLPLFKRCSLLWGDLGFQYSHPFLTVSDHCLAVLGAFAKSRVATISFFMPGHPSARMEQFGPH